MLSPKRELPAGRTRLPRHSRARRSHVGARKTLFRFTLRTGSSSLAPDAYAPSPGIELRPVPDEVAAPVPQTRGYRYVVASNRVLGTSRIVVGADANAR